MTNGGSATPPGWYPDGSGGERYWNGAAWTSEWRPTVPPTAPPPQWSPPTGPQRQRSGLLGLWVVLAVLGVVVVAVVVTLLVVQPWSGEEPAADDDPSGTPTPTSAESSGVTAPPAGTVRGDVDGDGRGDVVGRFYDDTESRLVLHSADGSFQVRREPVEDEEHLVVGDFDGDGGNEVASWSDESGTLHVTVEGSDVPELTQDFDLWFKVRQVKAAFGDFDGDGTDDAMAVVPNEPLVAGDFDDYYWYGDFGVVPLLAQPGAFGRGGISAIDTELYDQEHTVGDFDGDGKDSLVADDYLHDSLVLYEYDGSGLRPTGETVGYSIMGDGVMDALTATDLDGDGLDDLVFTSVDVDDYSFLGVWTTLADPSAGLGAPQKWGDLPDCKGDYCDVDYFDAG